MAAATAALDTYELLEIIITYLPPKAITQAQRVSKTWPKLIQASKAIEQARLLKPATKETYDRHENGRYLMKWPDYHTKARMSFNPAVFSYSSTPKHEAKTGYRYWITLMIPVAAIEDVENAPDKFLTDPPVTNALLYYSPRMHSFCELHSRNGITVKELLKVAQAMISTEFRYCDHHKRLNKISVSVEVTVVGARPRFQSLKGYSC